MNINSPTNWKTKGENVISAIDVLKMDNCLETVMNFLM